ncbi:MAG: S-layer homology domain-containing protein, partial [Clostridiales bacterium]|nr:S-layer homology domain-containing protein [Clostridiales bacterium]
NGVDDLQSKWGDNELTEPMFVINVSRGDTAVPPPPSISVKEQGTPPANVVGSTPVASTPQITPFIEGFEDSTFRGQSQMTREQFVAILARLKNDGEAPAASPGAKSFNDVATNRWSYNAIEWAKSAGIVDPDASGNFRPAAPLTRAEMAVMFVKAEKLTSVAENKFSDITGHYAESDILKAFDAGIFTGYEDGTFMPEGSTTRYEAVTALVRYLLGGEPEDSMWKDIKLTFTDLPGSNWAYKYVALAAHK